MRLAIIPDTGVCTAMRSAPADGSGPTAAPDPESALVSVERILAAVDLPAGARLPLEAALVLGSFALLGTLAGTIQRPDWAFLANWLRLRMLRES